jgi:hypothetical protein
MVMLEAVVGILVLVSIAVGASRSGLVGDRFAFPGLFRARRRHPQG